MALARLHSACFLRRMWFDLPVWGHEQRMLLRTSYAPLSGVLGCPELYWVGARRCTYWQAADALRICCADRC